MKFNIENVAYNFCISYTSICCHWFFNFYGQPRWSNSNK